MSAVDALLAEYDSCKNAAARAAWLEPHQLKAKGTIAALREGFLHHVCNCKSPVLESTLAKTTPAPGSLPVGEDPGGKDVHGAFFCSEEILQKKHPYVPLYFHSGCWQAMKNRGAKNTIHAAVMGWKYKSTWRGTKYVLSRNVEKLREVMGKLAEQHVDLSCLAYIVVTPDGLGTYETADMQSFSFLLGDLPRAHFSVLIRMTYAYSANGSFKAWRIADSGPPQQVLVHFLLKPCEGESFQVVDIERPDADLRSMTLAALYAAVGPQISRPPSDPPAPPREQGAAKVQVPVPDLQHTAAEAPKHMRFCLQSICGDKWSFSRALLFQINAEMQVVERNASGAPTDPGVDAKETTFIDHWKNGFLNGLISVLDELHKKARDPAELQVLEAAGDRYVELLSGDYVRLDDLHSMALVTGCQWRCTLDASARQCLPSSQFDAVYGNPSGPLSQHISASAMARTHRATRMGTSMLW